MDKVLGFHTITRNPKENIVGYFGFDNVLH